MTLKYSHTQKGGLWFYVCLMLALLMLPLLVMIWLDFSGIEEPSREDVIGQMIGILSVGISIPLMVCAAVMISCLTVRIDEESIRIRFGGGIWRKKILLDQIVSCKPVRNNWIDGWGIHYVGRRCWLYNIAGMEAVEVEYNNGKRTRIGTDDPQGLAEAIKEAIS
ncbi:MAG: hypothetical protein ACYTET_05045 [Planctomycetota bacterium]|jgi:hypothetical protein